MSTLRSGPVGAGPVLVVRTRQSDHRLQAGTAYRLGRDPGSDIVMSDSRVSWRHAVLRHEQDAWILEDVGSTNGTFIGTKRVDRITISAECVIRLGNPDDGPVLRCEPAARPVHAETEISTPAAARALLNSPDGDERAGPQVRPEAGPGWGDPGSGRGSGRGNGQRSGSQDDHGPGSGRGPADGGAGPVPSLMDPDQVRRPADYRLSVDRRPSAVLPLPARLLRIGRTPDNDLVLSDLSISRHHAELRKSSSGKFEIVDLGSHNGTFVNGQRVTSATLTEKDIVSVGHATFRLTDGELREYIDAGDVSLVAQDLVVQVGGGKILLDHVSFPIAERCLVGIIGPSGAGKSTLLGALTGMRPADRGVVLYDNRDLYKDYAELRTRIGLVPQDSIMHTQLTTQRALRYVAELRFPPDTHARERNARVDEVMSELALTRHAETRADKLSGGQLKRVNVALELLTKPSLLFLDEPTSGLDPGLDKSVMEQMRDLAHDGRTVIVVTHSVANLDVCDRLLVLVPGGKVAFFGPPEEGLSYFGQPGWAEVFQAFDRQPERDWAGEFAARGSTSVTSPSRRRSPRSPAARRPRAPGPRSAGARSTRSARSAAGTRGSSRPTAATCCSPP